jgi:ubiquinone/menaquinone biosynthesis C-methylase UbiE
MSDNQKKLQKDWYNDNKATCSYSLVDLNNQAHLKRLVNLLPNRIEGTRALEIGCGTGWYTKMLNPVAGVDISLVSIKTAASQLKSENQPPACTTKLMVADAENLPFKSGYFDVVYGFSILHHVEDIEKCLKEIHRVLKPNGFMAFGAENNAFCPLNYVFPFIYRNWDIEKGFRRISLKNISSILARTGFGGLKYDFGGFAIYGLSKKVYSISILVENLIERSKVRYFKWMKGYAGFFYFTAKKSTHAKPA